MHILASTYWQTNQKQKAIAMYDRIIAIMTKQPNANVQMLAGTYWARL